MILNEEQSVPTIPQALDVSQESIESNELRRSKQLKEGKETWKGVTQPKTEVGTPGRLRELPKDKKKGVENEWGAVFVCKDELDEIARENEYFAEKEKKQIYK